MKYIRGNHNMLIWYNDDIESEEFAITDDCIAFGLDNGKKYTGNVVRVNSICLYIQFSELSSPVPFPIKRITSVSKMI